MPSTDQSTLPAPSDRYIDDLDAANRKIEELYRFIEMTEAMLPAGKDCIRIRAFLRKEGVWK